MTRETIRDRLGGIVGSIDKSDKEELARDRLGRIVGRFTKHRQQDA